MKGKSLLFTLFLLVAGMGAQAQTAVTVGSQVTDEASLVSGNAYVVRYVGNGQSGYMKDTGSAYTGKSDDVATESAVYFFTDNGDGTWQVQNYFTGNYWGTPTANANTYIGSAAAGNWALNFQDGGNMAPSCNDHSWNRSGSNVHPWATGTANVNQLSVWEIELSSTAFAEFSGYDATVSSTEAASLAVGQWYVMYNRGRAGYAYENDSHYLYNQAAKPSGAAVGVAKFMVQLRDAGDGKYYLQTGLGNYFGVIPQNTAVPTTAIGTEKMTIGKIASTDGHFYIATGTDGRILDCQDNGYPVVGWNTSVPTSTGGNNDWAFYPVDLALGWAPTASEVYTINNTNSNRGALMYAPGNSTKWVWSSGKTYGDGFVVTPATFDASNEQFQWIFYPTGTEGQYYLYNVKAQRFAVPTTGGTYGGVCWKFSADAAPVALDVQDDGTYKIRAPYGDRYMAVSNNYCGPIINYNDEGGNFTITKVGDASSTVSAALTTAVARLVGNRTALTATSDFTTSGGWYVVKVNSGDWVGHSLFTAEEEKVYNSINYPLDFYGYGQEDASIASGERLLRITQSGSGYTVQMPNGRYLTSASNKFPVSTATAATVSIDKQTAGFRIYSGDWYAKPYNSSGNYFVGETSTSTAIYDIYAADLSDAGLVAWQVICDNAPETTQITCTRSDVSGLSAVYKNGYFFLPTGVTPESGDFYLSGATGVTVDATAKTITLAYDPTMAIVAEGVSTYQGYGTTGQGNEKAVLLRIVAAPFQNMETATLTATLTGADNIESVTLYETSNTVEWNAISSYTNTISGTLSDATATFNLGAVTAGTYYYWLCATVKAEATVGDEIDAALTSLVYNRAGQETVTCDLTSVGNPATAMKIFGKQKHLFAPTVDGDYCRIPALITADDGSIIAAADKRYGNSSDLGSHKIDVILRRSTDGGTTWSTTKTIAAGDGSSDTQYGYGDPAFVKTASGKLICLFACGKNGFPSGALKHFAMVTSTDNGATWTSPVVLTTSGQVTNTPNLSNFFVTSGKGLCTSDGTLMFLLDDSTPENAGGVGHERNYVLYSTDEGATWTIDTNIVYDYANEGKLVELSDGNLLSSTRQGGGRGFNTGTYTHNGDGTLTFTWGTQRQDNVLSQGGSGNNQDIIVYERNTDGSAKVLLHTITSDNGHRNLKLFMSIDQGESWNLVQTIQPGGSRYAVTTILDNGDLAILFEDYSLETGREYPINFITIPQSLIKTWYNEQVDKKMCPEVKIAYEAEGSPADYGAWDNYVWDSGWTSNAASGQSGLRLESSYSAGLNFAGGVYSMKVLAIKVSATGATDVITLKAPEGFVIEGYRLSGRSYNAGRDYTLTAADGTSVSTVYSAWNTLEVNDVNAAQTTFTVTTAQDQTNYLCVANFIVSLRPAYNLKLSPSKGLSYATLYLDYGCRLTEDVKAYKIDVSGELAYPTELGQKVPALTPVLLCSETEVTSALAIYDGAAEADASGNLLAGNATAQHVDGYVLNIVDDVAGFYKLSDTGRLAANRAYLPTSVAKSAGIKAFALNWGGADGIGETTAVDNERSTAVYDLLGRRIDHPTKGIYIVNGNKVIIK